MGGVDGLYGELGGTGPREPGLSFSPKDIRLPQVMGEFGWDIVCLRGGERGDICNRGFLSARRDKGESGISPGCDLRWTFAEVAAVPEQGVDFTLL